MNSSRISKNQVGPSHKVSKWFVVQWINKGYSVNMAQFFLDHSPYLWVFMHREDHLNIIKISDELTDSLVDMAHWFTQIFPSMSGDEDNPLIVIIQVVESGIGKGVILLNRRIQGIDNRIARYIEVIFLHIFFFEISLRTSCWSKMIGSNCTGQLTIGFFWKRRINITCSKACFHMAHRDFLIKGR